MCRMADWWCEPFYKPNVNTQFSSDIIEVLKRHGGWGLCEEKPGGGGFQRKKKSR